MKVLFFVPLIGQNRYDIVIDEIMADPSPSVALPNNEWLELRNTSTAPINLQNWRIGDASGQSGPLPNFTLQPDSLVIICTSSAVAVMSAFGTIISVTSFPSLDNDGDLLFLKAANGKMIHALNYSVEWYRHETKQEGGWSLEMIDTKNPCAGMNNWKPSIHTNGGTPGKKNSVNDILNDTESPQLKRAYTTDSLTIILVYDEPVDSLSGATLANYSIDGGLSFINAASLPPVFNLVQLKVNSAMTNSKVYTITANNIKDCKGNMIGAYNKTKVGLPSDAAAGEWIINEILFNPLPNGYDYVEFYNNSQKIFDASHLSLANRNSTGVISSIRTLSPGPYYIFPGDHIVITEDYYNLFLHYLVSEPANVLSVSSMPSFPDDDGDVVALNFQGAVVDEVKYKDDWHFKLLSGDEGVSLERIDPVDSSQSPLNWHSAASTSGYGTPTYKNSQYRSMQDIQAMIEVGPKIISPDNNGRDDFATIQYEMAEPGFVANIMIFDAAGRPVRTLVRNGTLGLKGSWNWDGLDDKGGKLPMGIYVILTEIFNLRGKTGKFKNAVVLAREN